MKTTRKPRDFTWVIQNRLAVSSRVGGHGMEHRRVRRQQEISWLLEAGFDTVISLLPGNQNANSYESAGMDVHLVPVGDDHDPESIDRAYQVLQGALSKPDSKVLVHREFVDDTVGGLLAGFIVFAGLVDDPRIAMVTIQEIIGRPLGPDGRSLIPSFGA
ncbi:MAG: hypothetical protein F4Y75_09580 [Acidimicrobiia bacterium]|nr:hypothetical protein [bacterium]MXX64931.1 hypothetical protein [Acidimicrobiia bacterium]MXZ07725.1 hypothetical protein [Acidimicrobiia bacterium]MYD03868.1 hypothetical protein [Acidimicrobiia bacterium]MYF26086.1 hypothetical protein [Acidimicrobiia bacterium]